MKIINIFTQEEENLGSFIDNRGGIYDVFYGEAINHACWISSKAGAVRGNHYHKFTVQYTLVLQGKLLYASRLMGEKAIESGVFTQGSLIISPPMEAHAMRAEDGDCVFLAFAQGPRGGTNYEVDTYRLSEQDYLI